MESVTETDLANIENKIQKYLDFFRKKFSEALLPKHHLLEGHVLEWMEKWQFGMAMHGQPREESIHREFNRIERYMCLWQTSLKIFYL